MTQGHLYVTRGDITRLQADAIAVTAGQSFSPASPNSEALATFIGKRFCADYQQGMRERDNGTPSFWIPYERGRPPYGALFVNPFLAHPGATGAVRPGYDVAKEAVTAAVGHVRTYTFGRVLIALVAFRMNLGGDRNDRLRAAREQVEAVYDVLPGLPDVDVAFVLDDATKYEIFLDARRQVCADRGIVRPVLAAPDRPQMEELIAALQSEECVLFVGAGLSSGAGVTSYRSLIEEMADACGLHNTSLGHDDYLDVAQCYRDQASSAQEAEQNVARLIRKHFGDAAFAEKGIAPSLAHYLLLSLPVRFILTTNYDRLIEQTLEALQRYPLRVLNSEHVAQTGLRDGMYVIKLHGDCEGGPVVLSRDDYTAFFRDRPEMAALLEGLLLNQTFFFTGYSLKDLNFQQIYGKIDLMLQQSKRPAFATTFDAVPEHTRRVYARRRMNLVPFTPPDPASDSRYDPQFYAFLDRLAEEVTGSARLFLTDDAWPAADTSALAQPRRDLMAVGNALAAAILAPDLSLVEARLAVRIFSLLADLGWRPRTLGWQSL